jgi:uncharacterized protein YwgA
MVEFERIIEEIQTINSLGEEIILEAVPKLKDSKSGRTWVKIEDVVNAENKYIAKKNNIKLKQFPLLSVLYAKLPHTVKIKGLNISQGQIREATRMNKLLFEIWQRTKDAGCSQFYPQLEFYPDVYGPVSKDLKPLMEDLKKQGLVNVKWAKKNGETTEYMLTEKGFEIAKNIWEETSDEIKQIIISTKDKLAFSSSKEIIDYFHKKYPEYRKIKEFKGPN